MAMIWNHNWAIEPADEVGSTVVLSAGRDRRVAIDGLTPSLVAALAAWADGAPVDVDVARGALLDRLVEIGAITVSTDSTSVALMGPEALVGHLGEHLANHAISTTTIGAHDVDLTVVVRDGSGWPDVAGLAPHLGVDLTTHHTVVLGPFVVPGATSCLGCVDQRAQRRWGVPVVPPAPAITRHLAAVASLLAVQVELARAGTSPLVNATVAWDLEQGTTDRQSAYKLVGCPTCDVGEHSGQVALPWTTTSSAVAT